MEYASCVVIRLLLADGERAAALGRFHERLPRPALLDIPGLRPRSLNGRVPWRCAWTGVGPARLPHFAVGTMTPMCRRSCRCVLPAARRRGVATATPRPPFPSCCWRRNAALQAPLPQCLLRFSSRWRGRSDPAPAPPILLFVPWRGCAGASAFVSSPLLVVPAWPHRTRARASHFAAGAVA